MNGKNWLNNPVIAVLSGVVLITLGVYLVMLTVNEVKEGRYIGRPDTERDTITITGEGRVTAIPDVGQITVSIVTEGKEANDAQEENIEQFNQLVEALKEEGVKEEDLKTSNYSLSPRYRYDEGERTQIGFEVRQSLTVKIRDLDASGKIISLASQNGVNQVSGLSFTIDDPEIYREEARKKALEQAREKAEELADLADVNLGKIVSFSESGGGAPIPSPVFRTFDTAEIGIGGGVPEPDFEAGSEEVVVTATIEFEIF